MTLLQPVAYAPSVERPEPTEAKATAAINKSMRGILETTGQDYGHSVRGVHAKSHGLLQGELRVLDGLPGELAQDMFARLKTYPVVLGVSNDRPCRRPRGATPQSQRHPGALSPQHR